MIFVKILLWMWQIPQHFIAVMLLLIWRPERKIIGKGSKESHTYYHTRQIKCGLSLGIYRFIPIRFEDNALTQLHEWGHSKQSVYLGPLYLLIIGLPFLFRNRLQVWLKKDSAWYYSGYPEKWADKLGGVKRV